MVGLFRCTAVKELGWSVETWLVVDSVVLWCGRYPTLSITNSKKPGMQEARALTTKPMTNGPFFVTTQDFTATHSLAKRIETALESLPNNVIQEVEVRADSRGSCSDHPQ